MTDALRPRLPRETPRTMAESPEVNSESGVNFFPLLLFELSLSGSLYLEVILLSFSSVCELGEINAPRTGQGNLGS